MAHKTSKELDLEFPCALARLLAGKSAGYTRVDRYWNFGTLHGNDLIGIQKDLIAEKLEELMVKQNKDIEELQEQHKITQAKAIKEAIEKDRAANREAEAASKKLVYG